MTNDRRIWCDTQHKDVIASVWGSSVYLELALDRNAPGVSDIKFYIEGANYVLEQADAIVENRIPQRNHVLSLDNRSLWNSDVSLGVEVRFPHSSDLRSGLSSLRANIRWRDGSFSSHWICSVNLQLCLPTAAIAQEAKGCVGIVMATYNPDPQLFAGQIASIKNQTHRNFHCVVVDDGSSAQRFHSMQQEVGEDHRFTLMKLENVGFYKNFERGVALLPASCEYIAFSDQDDIWSHEKLEKLLRLIESGSHELVFSDMKVATPDGTVISSTFWTYRKLEQQSFSALAVANSVTGMTMLFRRGLLDLAMPFPSCGGQPFHDAWISLCARAKGSIGYSVEPLVIYLQHGSNHTGAVRRPPTASRLMLSMVKSLVHLIVHKALRSRFGLFERHFNRLAYWQLEVFYLQIFVSSIIRRESSMTQDNAKSFMQVLRTTRPLTVPLGSLSDSYRRYRLVGLSMGKIMMNLKLARYLH